MDRTVEAARGTGWRSNEGRTFISTKKYIIIYIDIHMEISYIHRYRAIHAEVFGMQQCYPRNFYGEHAESVDKAG